MKKQTHPHKVTTKIQLKDGSVYLKKWLFFRDDLVLDVDTTSHGRWQRLHLDLESTKKNKK